MLQRDASLTRMNANGRSDNGDVEKRRSSASVAGETSAYVMLVLVHSFARAARVLASNVKKTFDLKRRGPLRSGSTIENARVFQLGRSSKVCPGSSERIRNDDTND